MDELDAELLALAGEETKRTPSPPAATGTNGRKRSEPPTSLSPPKTKKSKSAPGKKSAKRKSRREYSDNEEDE